MNILEATLSHIISQLCYKNLPAPRLVEPEDSSQVQKLPLKTWKKFIEDNCHDTSRPWAALFERNLGSECSIVLKEIQLIQESARAGYQYLSICDPIFPYLLRQIKDPPFGLMYLGDPSVLQRPALAIIGARKAATDSLFQTQELAKMLSDEGATIVSGGAIGCDTAAHLGALVSKQRPSPTVVVMAGSIDHLYPRCNLHLYRRIVAEGGLIISERLLRTAPKPRDFPIRNRIISGLSNRVLVMQAAQRSGAMATANLALNQGRDVMVYDPEREDIRFTGSRKLMDQGALCFNSANDYFQLNWE